MSKFFSFLTRLAPRRYRGTFSLPSTTMGDGLIFGRTRQGRVSELTLKIEATGARPGETVAIDEHGQARVLGRKPEVVSNTPK
jgi:hypothetical protein